MKPYGILSDLHFHAWSQFATADARGVNSRLMTILEEVRRAAGEVIQRGGDTLFLAGDIYHVRGAIDPEVQNPVTEFLGKLVAETGVKIHAIPGNHDLAGKDSAWLGNSIEALGEICNVSIWSKSHYDREHQVAMIPWYHSLSDLRERVKKIHTALTSAKVDPLAVDLIIHAPLNGVLRGIPDHGLDPDDLSHWGFRRVFCGHYHNHVETAIDVYSIGALTHQTWSDVDTLAGFIIVEGDKVEHRESQAPKFIDYDGDNGAVGGNYIRLKLTDADNASIRAAREELLQLGAAGVSIIPVKSATKTQRTSTVKAGSSIEVSVGEFITHKKYANEQALTAECLDIMSEARAAA